MKRAQATSPRRPAPGPRPEPAEPAAAVATSSFPIVCVGASAGGLQAFTELLHALPPDTGMAFVLVQHLSADHASILPEILARTTAMPVHQVEDGTPFRPNYVEVIPPDKDIEVVDGHMVLVERQRRARHMPVDLCLRTLSEAHRERAIGVILSGTGSDGTLGMLALKASGGISFVQDPETAQYDGMPQSAIAAGCVDFVLSPSQIAAELTRVAATPYVRSGPREATSEEHAAGHLDRIFAVLRRQTGVDFTAYKKTTLRRRLARRMTVIRLDTVAEYAAYLESHPDEVQALFDEFLIHVTSFFRDPETFEVLARDVFPRLVQERGAGAGVRVWVPGCATGEEAYSVAICLMEAAADAVTPPPIQVFATDVSEAAIQRARAGVYMENIAQDVSPERLLRFFSHVDGQYQVNKAVRDACVFARQDLTRDPPFSRLDLVTCRNVLIYLEPALQRRVLATFHYALRPRGCLLLGTSETAGVSSDLFEPLDRQHKTYSRKDAPPQLLGLGSLARTERPPAAIAAAPGAADLKTARVRGQREADRILAARYGPPSVLVDEKLEIIQFRGDTQPYLSHHSGEASVTLASMVRRGLLAELREVVQEAHATGVAARRRGLRVERGRGSHLFDVEAVPIVAPGGAERQTLILFDAQSPAASPPDKAALADASGDRDDTTQLHEEVAALRRQQQASDEENDAAREELQTATEEILSSNEELQSINEELEAGKEELQSTNEELSTLNEELRNRNLQMTRLNDDLTNLQASADIPIVMLDASLAVRRFTPSAARLLGLAGADVGRRFLELRQRLVIPDLERILLRTLETAQGQDLELQDPEGSWYRLQFRPYRTQDNRLDGIVLLALDIDALKRSAQAVAEARDTADAVVDTARDPLLVLDEGLRVVRANAAFYREFETTPETTEGILVYALPGAGSVLGSLRPRLAQPLPGNGAFDGVPLERAAGDGGKRVLHASARPMRGRDAPGQILLALEDVTDREEARNALVRSLALEQDAVEKARHADHLKDEFIATLSHELRGPLASMSGWLLAITSPKCDGDTMTRGLAAIGRGVATQTRLIEDLLDVSRIAAGKLMLAPQTLDLRPLVAAVAEGLMPACAAKEIDLQVAAATSEVVVRGDADRLQQVVWNLASNAVKFTPRGGRIRIALDRVGNEARLVVTDDGRGIDPDFLPHVFGRFRQADAAARSAGSGLGLGLAIVRQLVELHGGTVQAESGGHGKGATFTVALPVPALRNAEAVAPTTATRALEGLSVLVVEDDADSLDLLAMVLSQAGARVARASSADAALAALAYDVPDVLVSDIGMPERDGYSLITAIRSLPDDKGGAMAAIALSAFVQSSDRERARVAGFDDHLSKPADTPALIERIATLARQRRR